MIILIVTFTNLGIISCVFHSSNDLIQWALKTFKNSIFVSYEQVSCIAQSDIFVLSVLSTFLHVDLKILAYNILTYKEFSYM